MLNPMTLPIVPYSRGIPPPQYQSCNPAGLSYISALTYMQARNFVISDRETPSVTLVGKVFDAVLDTAPVQTVIKTLDSWGRYLFDVCETSDSAVSKKRLHPVLIVVLMSGDGRNLTLNCTSEFAIKSLKEGKQINDTVELTLLQNDECQNWGKQSICVGDFYSTYFIDYTPSYELYNLSDTLGENEWNYTNGSWSVFCSSQFNLPSSFLFKVQKDLDQVIACEQKRDTILFITLGLAVAVPTIGVLIYCGIKAVEEEEECLPLVVENHPPNYGALAL